MKPCHKSNQNQRRPPAQQAASGSRAASSSPPAVAVHRYVHPIRTTRPAARPPVEALLGDVLEALSRQSEQLEEVLRRLERDNSDTN